MMMVVVVGVDLVDIQMMDWKFDRDFLVVDMDFPVVVVVVDKDFVDNHH